MLCGDIERQPGLNSLTRDEFQQQFISRKRLKIIYQNIRGISSNFDMLQEFLVLHKNIDIATLLEPHLSEESLLYLSSTSISINQQVMILNGLLIKLAQSRS